MPIVFGIKYHLEEFLSDFQQRLKVVQFILWGVSSRTLNKSPIFKQKQPNP
jgi:hypothetical protein